MTVANQLKFLPVGDVPESGVMGVEDRVLISTPTGVRSVPPSAVGVDVNGVPIAPTAETIQFDRTAIGTVPKSIYVITKEREISLSEFNGVLGNGVASPETAAANAQAFSNFLRACSTEKRQGVIPQGDYVVNPILMTNIDSMFIRMHPEARVRGMRSYQDFAGNGAQTVFIPTEFAVNVPGRYLVATRFSSGGQESAWQRGVHYTSTANSVTLMAGTTVASGEILRVVSNEALIELYANARVPNISPRFLWEGGTIDINERGVALSQASGSGLTLSNFQRVDLEKMDLYGAATYEAGVLKGVADSGITVLGTSYGRISGCKFIGIIDVGIYITGGGLADTSDDGRSFIVEGNHFLESRSGVTAKRSIKDVIFCNNTFTKVRYPASLSYTLATDPPSGKGSIHGNIFRRCGARAIWVMLQRGCVVSNNTIIDCGYLPDGVSLDNSQSTIDAIFLDGCTDTRVHNNVITMDELAGNINMRGIRLAKKVLGSVTYECNDNVVTNNSIRDVGTGVLETDAGTGNILRENDMKDVTTPYSVPTSRRWQYRISNKEFEGIGANAFEGTFVPTVTFSGAAPPISYSTQYGRYVRVGNLVHFWIRLAFNPIHTLTTNEFRINGLPYAADTNTDHRNTAMVGVLSSGVALPANTIQLAGRVIFGTSYVRMESLVLSAGNVIWGASQFPTATTHVIEIQGTYEVAAEAQN